MKSYQAVSAGMDGRELAGTITMDEAGKITYTVEPGKEQVMAWLMDAPIPIATDEPPMRRVTRQSNPALWFEWLPIQYHGSAFYVVPLAPGEKPGEKHE
jgi:hypothetical protein